MGLEPSAVTFTIENQDNGRFLYENQDEIFKGTNVFVGVELESGFFCIEGSSYMHLGAWMERIFRITFVLQNISPV